MSCSVSRVPCFELNACYVLRFWEQCCHSMGTPSLALAVNLRSFKFHLKRIRTWMVGVIRGYRRTSFLLTCHVVDSNAYMFFCLDLRSKFPVLCWNIALCNSYQARSSRGSAFGTGQNC